jgi:hypothetical protein
MPEGDEKITDSQEFKDAIAAALEEETAGLKANRDALIAEKRAERTKRQELEARYDGIDPDKHREMLEEAKKKAANAAKDEGDWEKREAQIAEEYGEKIKKAEGRADALMKALENELIEKAAIAGISKHTQEVDLLLPHVRRRLQMQEVDGQFRAVVVDEAGDPQFVPSDNDPSQRVAMSLNQLIEQQIKPKFAAAFPGSGGSGAGSSGSDGTGQESKTVVPMSRLEEPKSAGDFLADLEALNKDGVKVKD